ncbi:hypothetical protein [Chromobacterium violaceum]|uniref:hypothetical protein n=1 Tax=Chromobacterium violaceum TaxID=536 RepID=UPI001B33157E|nr:hypothetical protein [Chromobacterium violaceum]MBP4045186.1 hypothetical protein [Chromobacterium violaceum]
MVDNVPFSQIPQSLTTSNSVIGRASSVRVIGVIEGWIALGYIPCAQIGCHCLVNFAALIKRCIEQAELCLSFH